MFLLPTTNILQFVIKQLLNGCSATSVSFLFKSEMLNVGKKAPGNCKIGKGNLKIEDKFSPTSFRRPCQKESANT